MELLWVCAPIVSGLIWMNLCGAVGDIFRQSLRVRPRARALAHVLVGAAMPTWFGVSVLLV
jgi:hypothetical protein